MAGVELKGSSRSKLAQLMTNHGLGDVDRHVLAAVMYGQSVAEHVGDDGRTTRPGLDDLLFALLVEGIDLLEQVLVDEGALF